MQTATQLPNLCSLDSIPGPGESIDCTACGRTCDLQTVRRCRVKGPAPTKPASRTPQPVQRMDWLAEMGGCEHAGPVVESLPCGCRGQGEVAIWSCSQPTLSGECVVLDGDLQRLHRAHHDRARTVAACETCQLRVSEDMGGGWHGLRPGEGRGLPTLATPFEDSGRATPQPTVRHCIGHLWPNAANDTWRWNLRQLRDRIDLFNGRRILSVALDSSTVSRAEVEAEIDGLGLEVLWTTNDPRRGEGVSFLTLLDHLGVESLGESDAVWYWHGKGASGDRPRKPLAVVQEWTAALWSLGLDRWPLVAEALTRACAVGPFRATWPKTSRVFFQGNFFWFRPSSLAGRNWRQLDHDRFAVEKWAGQIFAENETQCLFSAKNQQPTALYREATWQALRPRLTAWQRGENWPSVAEDASREGAKARSSTDGWHALKALRKGVGTLATPFEDSGRATRARPKVSAAIIITCGPKYDRWVRDAIASALEQEGSPEIVCVFDRCEPIEGIDPRVKVLRVDQGAVQLARRAGIAASTGEVLFFLDADNAYRGSRFVVDAVAQLRSASKADARVAGVSVDITYHDQHWKPTGRKLITPDHWDRERFDRSNFLDTCTPVWRHAMEASWRQSVANGSHEDYHAWRQLVHDGWTFGKGRGLTLKYRIMPDSSSHTKGQGNYATRYGLHVQPLTLFVPLSGRDWAWPGLRDWLAALAATERGKSVRLVLCDTSGRDDFGAMIHRDLPGLGFWDSRYYRQSVATSGLADLDRVKHERAVQIACAGIYNRLAQECTTPLVLIVEDDILPHLSGEKALRELVDGLGEQVVGVSGIYHDRRHGKINSWYTASHWHVQHVTQQSLDTLAGEYLPIGGTGFGCLLIRRETLRSVPHALPPGEVWYDPRFFNSVITGGRTLLLAKRVTCDHRDKPSSTKARP